MRIELKVRRGQWDFFGAFFLVLGLPFAIAAPLLLLEAIIDQNAGALVGVVLGGMFSSVSIPAGVVAWRIGHSHPAIIVTNDGLSIEHPGLFASPVAISRSAVHSVYVRPFQGTQRPPKFEGNAWQRLRQTSRWADDQSVQPSPLPISSWHCPDLSLLSAIEDHNLLIVMDNSMAMRDFARRGLGALTAAMSRGPAFTGPTKATAARGFFGVAVDEEPVKPSLHGRPPKLRIQNCGTGSTQTRIAVPDGWAGVAGARRSRCRSSARKRIRERPWAWSLPRLGHVGSP